MAVRLDPRRWQTVANNWSLAVMCTVVRQAGYARSMYPKFLNQMSWKFLCFPFFWQATWSPSTNGGQLERMKKQLFTWLVKRPNFPRGRIEYRRSSIHRCRKGDSQMVSTLPKHSTWGKLAFTAVLLQTTDSNNWAHNVSSKLAVSCLACKCTT